MRPKKKQPLKVVKHIARIDAFSEVRNAINQRIIDLEGGLEHVVEGNTIDSRVEGLKEAEMLVMRIQGEAIGWFDKPKKRSRKKVKRR